MAPAGDNLCNDFQQETAHSYLALARARGDATERIEGVVCMADAAVALPFWNRAVLEQPMTAADLGRPIYEKLGFAAMLRVTYWLGLRS
jgi:hypothetical protein